MSAILEKLEKQVNPKIFVNEDKRKVEISFEIDDEEIKKEIENMALKYLQRFVDVPGFRRGHAPLNLIKNHVKPEIIKNLIIEELVSLANKILYKKYEKGEIENFYANLIDDINFQEKDNKWIFSVKFELVPKIEYNEDELKKTIDISLEDISEVKEDEVNQFLNGIKINYSKQRKSQNGFLDIEDVKKIKGFEDFDISKGDDILYGIEFEYEIEKEGKKETAKIADSFSYKVLKEIYPEILSKLKQFKEGEKLILSREDLEKLINAGIDIKLRLKDNLENFLNAGKITNIYSVAVKALTNEELKKELGKDEEELKKLIKQNLVDTKKENILFNIVRNQILQLINEGKIKVTIGKGLIKNLVENYIKEKRINPNDEKIYKDLLDELKVHLFLIKYLKDKNVTLSEKETFIDLLEKFIKTLKN